MLFYFKNMKKKIIIISLLFCISNLITSCNNESYTSFKEFIDIVKSQNSTTQDIFIFKSSSCSNCKKIQPYLDRYIKENDNENLNIHTINLDVNNNGTFADNTLGSFTGNTIDDGLSRLDSRINNIIYDNNIKTGDNELINTYPYVSSKYIYIFTPLIIWYQNGIEYKISNNVLNNLNTIDDETAYSSFKEFMEFPQASLYLQVKPFNIESL